MPADCRRKTNGPALPSIIGTSEDVRSTNALSIPRPAKADNKCSTVETLTPSLTKLVERFVLPTFSARAGISTTGSRSCRQNTIPVSTGAGLTVKNTVSPVCKPMPVALIAFFRVLCLIISLTVPDVSYVNYNTWAPQSALFIFQSACLLKKAGISR